MWILIERGIGICHGNSYAPLGGSAQVDFSLSSTLIRLNSNFATSWVHWKKLYHEAHRRSVGQNSHRDLVEISQPPAVLSDPDIG